MQDKKQKLLKALADTIRELRGEQSISKLSLEVDVSKSIWSKLEKAERDVQLTTIWKIAEALNIKVSDFMKKIEVKLEDEFSFIE